MVPALPGMAPEPPTVTLELPPVPLPAAPLGLPETPAGGFVTLWSEEPHATDKQKSHVPNRGNSNLII